MPRIQTRAVLSSEAVTTLAVRTEDSLVDAARMALEFHDDLPGLRTPEARRLVLGSRENLFAVSAENCAFFSRYVLSG